MDRQGDRQGGLRGPRGFLASNGERIYYETHGAGIPVIFSHGYGGNHASWYQQVTAFASRYQVVTWDQRGFGRSTNLTGHPGPAGAVADLGRLLDDLDLRQVHLIGQSMGGWAALGLALRFPERVLSLTLTDSIAGIYTPAIERAYDAVRSARAAGPPLDQYPVGRHPALGYRLSEVDPSLAFLYEQLTSLCSPPPASVLDLLRNTAYPDAELRRVEIPVLFIVGSEDPIFSPSVIREAASVLPRGRVVEIPEAGHSPYFERARLWNQVVLEFLAAAESGAA
jgi:3-oxoadipate enol-lactonase